LDLILASTDRIIVTSENYMRSSVHLQKFLNKCIVIPLGIEQAPFLKERTAARDRIRTEYGRPLLLFVGKLRYYKGLQYLLEAMKEIPARLLVIGSGPMESEWRSVASSTDLQGKVFFLGEIGGEDLAGYYQAADLFVLPASERSEAFGLVQVEAMASELPVISTDLGTGTSYVNIHGETGLVVPPKDSQGLRDAILTLLGDSSLRQAMGKRGRQRAASEFSLNRMVEQTLDLYESVYSA
jgi:rhamnosyl/mannosyltransferase